MIVRGERDNMIVAGFGFRREAGLAALRDALALAQRGQPPVTALATAADKAEQLAALAEMLRLPLIAIAPDVLEAIQTPTRSPASLAARHSGSVAEACALAAAGFGSKLLTSRHISGDRMATCAIAQAITPHIIRQGA